MTIDLVSRKIYGAVEARLHRIDQMTCGSAVLELCGIVWGFHFSQSPFRIQAANYRSEYEHYENWPSFVFVPEG